MIDYTKVLIRKYPDTLWTLNGDEYAGLTWLDEAVQKPTKKQLDDLWPTVEAEIEAEIAAKEATRSAVLEKLGVTSEELALLLG
jgi:hypothetical protein